MKIIIAAFVFTGFSVANIWGTDTTDSGVSTLISAIPNQLQTNTRTLDVTVDNLPSTTDHFECVFTILGKTFITTATRKNSGVTCPTPSTDLLLSSIYPGQNYFTAKIAVRMADIVTTNVTFYDCKTYNSCTQCVSSPFPCNWCLDGHRCTHDTAENCKNDIIVSGISTRFVCQFNIEGKIRTANARLLGDTIYCDPVEFIYESKAPNITVPMAVIWGGSRQLDNPNNLHIVVYRCRDMADSCGTCLMLGEEYGCGWCPSSESCEVRDHQCNEDSAVWLNRKQTCPNPEVASLKPELTP